MPTEDQTPTNEPTSTPTPTEPRGPLTDAELQADFPAVAVLVGKLEAIAADALYLADPRQGVKATALAFAAYFRTAD